eukprot:scaffold26.g3350.t1
MVLRALHGLGGGDDAQQHQCSMAGLARLCGTQSVWTIDLAHLLAGQGAPQVRLLTVTIGANAAYSTERFYSAHIEQDAARVGRLFQEAESAGIHVEQRSVSLQLLQRWAADGRHLLILLVDKSILLGADGTQGSEPVAPGEAAVWARGTLLPQAAHMPAPRASELRTAQEQDGSQEQMLPQQPGRPEFTGHYVVVCSYDPGADAFCLRDPAAAAESTWVPSGRLEAARKAFGTDEDLLLVEAAPLRDRRGRAREAQLEQQHHRQRHAAAAAL